MDLVVKRKTNGARVRQDTLADTLGFHRETMMDIELGRIGIDEETYEQIISKIDELSKPLEAPA